MLKMNIVKTYMCILKRKSFLPFFIFFIICIVLSSENTLSKTKEPRLAINGSGLKIPRIVSTKNSLTYIRSGPGKDFPVKFELKKKGFPLKIIAEYNNWRKITTFNNINGWIHTQLLSSLRTGLITKTTYLKIIPSNSGNSIAKLLPNLLINVKKCNEDWCKIEVDRRKIFIGWIKKENIWGSTKN